MSSKQKVKKKHLATVKCPACNALIDIIEKETIQQPHQKKISDKEILVEKSVQKTL